MDALHLQNAFLRLTVAPQGASVISFESLRHGKPIFHPANPALFPMLPLANRVAGNAFHLHGKRIQLPDSPVDEHFFLHGDGWQKLWHVEQHEAESVTLSLRSQHPCGFHYLANLTYRLAGNRLLTRLELTHIGEKPMIYGLGLHPYFALEADSRVQFSASGYWPEGEQHLPLAWEGTFSPQTDFSRAKTPENKWLNVGYSGWSGRAVITHSDMNVCLRSPAACLMVFRIENQPFICLEPQTHPVNAHNMAGMPGLVMLETGQTTHLEMEIEVS